MSTQRVQKVALLLLTPVERKVIGSPDNANTFRPFSVQTHLRLFCPPREKGILFTRSNSYGCLSFFAPCRRGTRNIPGMFGKNFWIGWLTPPTMRGGGGGGRLSAFERWDQQQHKRCWSEKLFSFAPAPTHTERKCCKKPPSALHSRINSIFFALEPKKTSEGYALGEGGSKKSPPYASQVGLIYQASIYHIRIRREKFRG